MGAYIFWACFLASLKIKQRSKKAEAFCWLLGSSNLIVIFLQVFIWMLLLFVQVSFIQRVGYDGVQKKKKKMRRKPPLPSHDMTNHRWHTHTPDDPLPFTLDAGNGYNVSFSLLYFNSFVVFTSFINRRLRLWYDSSSNPRMNLNLLKKK